MQLGMNRVSDPPTQVTLYGPVRICFVSLLTDLLQFYWLKNVQ